MASCAGAVRREQLLGPNSPLVVIRLGHNEAPITDVVVFTQPRSNGMLQIYAGD